MVSSARQVEGRYFRDGCMAVCESTEMAPYERIDADRNVEGGVNGRKHISEIGGNKRKKIA